MKGCIWVDLLCNRPAAQRPRLCQIGETEKQRRETEKRSSASPFLHFCAKREGAFMVQESGINKRLWLFFLLAYSFSWLFWTPQALAANGIAIPAGVSAFLSGPFNLGAFGPLVAALVLTFLDEGRKGVIGLLRRGLDVRFRRYGCFLCCFCPPPSSQEPLYCQYSPEQHRRIPPSCPIPSSPWSLPS